MGQPAFSKIYVSFETEDKAKEAEVILKKFNEIIKERWKGDSDLANLERAENAISCEAHSGRVQNCEWQVERVVILVAEVGGVIEFTSDIFLMGDGMTWNSDCDDNTFKEFASGFKDK